MLAIGAEGMPGVAAVLGVAAVVSGACSVSGTLIQDLKAGYLLGGTPWKMQVVEILAVILLSVFLMAPIVALHQANLATGGIGGRPPPAPPPPPTAHPSAAHLRCPPHCGLVPLRRPPPLPLS